MSMRTDMATPHLDDTTQVELEAAAFRTLVEHFRAHPEVQNIDLMNLAAFCRNCLSKWYRAAAEERGLEMSYDQAREIVYGMPYEDWKAKYQTEGHARAKGGLRQASRRAALAATAGPTPPRSRLDQRPPRL